jgi:hypothetical protein
LDPPVAPPRGPAIDILFNLGGGRYRTRWQCPPGGPLSTSSSTLVVAAAGPIGSTPLWAHHRRPLQPRWWPLPDPPTAPLRVSAIDVLFNLGGGHCRTHRQHPPGGPPSTSSSTLMVATAGPADSAPLGGLHRRLLQPRWWPLPGLPAAPLGGPSSMSYS